MPFVPSETMLMWEAHATRVNDALDAEQITGVLNFYANLERLANLQRDIMQAHAVVFRGTSSVFGNPLMGMGTISNPQDWQAYQQVQDTEFKAKQAEETRIEKYSEFEPIAVELLQVGNPLPKPPFLAHAKGSNGHGG